MDESRSNLSRGQRWKSTFLEMPVLRAQIEKCKRFKRCQWQSIQSLIKTSTIRLMNRSTVLDESHLAFHRISTTVKPPTAVTVVPEEIVSVRCVAIIITLVRLATKTLFRFSEKVSSIKNPNSRNNLFEENPRTRKHFFFF